MVTNRQVWDWGCSGSGWFNVYCFEQKKSGVLPRAGCRGPGVSVTSVLLYWHLQDRTGIYSRIPLPLASFHHHHCCCCCPRCEGARLCCCWQRAGVCSHKSLHREAGESACAALSAGAGSWQCACRGDRCHRWNPTGMLGHLCSLLAAGAKSLPRASCRRQSRVGSWL